MNNTLSSLVGIHSGKPLYIIGKGPSLDAVTPELFEPGCPIIAIAEAIKTIEDMYLTNPIYSLQREPGEEWIVTPRKATLLLSLRAKWELPFYQPRFVYDYTMDGGIMPRPSHCSAGDAVSIAALMGASEVKMISFDSYTNGEVGYSSCAEPQPLKKKKAMNVYRQINKKIISFAKTFGMKISWIEPGRKMEHESAKI